MKILFLLLISLSVIANDDPWEDFNRTTFKFNQTLDENIFEPVARGYKESVPQNVQNRVSDFSSNLGDISTLGNEILQFEALDSANTLSRVLINSTLGLLGLFDVASMVGLEKTSEDFGQTMAVWGASSGPYVVLPVFGSSTIRDTTGLVVDSVENNKVVRSLDSKQSLSITLTRAVDTRVKLLPVTDLLKNSGDPYISTRSSYLQKRKFDIYDGDLPVEEDEF